MKKLNSTTYTHSKQTHKGNIEAEVGDVKQSIFYPQVKLKVWDNETNFSVRYKDSDEVDLTPKKIGNKITAQGKNKKFHFYPTEENTKTLPGFEEVPIKHNNEGGFEFEIELEKKPASNIFEYTIETKDLDFFYQPPLTEEELYEDEVERPENVVGSYAVYHKTKKHDWTGVGGKNYATGKAFHIFRPKAVDSKGEETWCDLNINEEEKLLTITVPQEFLDKAVYPVIVDPTFGYTSAGLSSGIFRDIIVGSQFTGSAGTGTSISIYYKATTSSSTVFYKMKLYKQSDLSGVTNGETGEGNTPTNSSWNTLNFASSPTLSAIDYVVCVWGNGSKSSSNTIGYDTSDFTGQGRSQSITYTSSWPDPLSPVQEDRKYSIYVTYTAGGGRNSASGRSSASGRNSASSRGSSSNRGLV